MISKLIKTTSIAVETHQYSVSYYEIRTLSGTRRYSSEIVLSPDGPDDRVILDDDTMSGLESRVARLIPATLYSRALAMKRTAVA